MRPVYIGVFCPICHAQWPNYGATLNLDRCQFPSLINASEPRLCSACRSGKAAATPS